MTYDVQMNTRPIRHWERMRQMTSRTGLSRSFIYSAIANGRFPSGLKVTDRLVVWDAAEVDAWMAAAAAKVAA